MSLDPHTYIHACMHTYILTTTLITILGETCHVWDRDIPCSIPNKYTTSPNGVKTDERRAEIRITSIGARFDLATSVHITNV